MDRREPVMIAVESLTHRYGSRAALDGVSFAVPPACCFGLLGPNGGGKTTLFRILCTLMQPASGRATIDGFDVSRQRAEVRRRIGVVFQSPSLDEHLTVRENLRHGGRLYGLDGAGLEQKIDECLQLLGVADRAKDRVKALSGGLRRRAELAKVLLHAPPVLLLDEPSTGLDPRARRELWEQLARLRDAGTTVLLTTHFMDEAERCDRLVILDQGKVVAEGRPEEMKRRVGGECLTIECARPEELHADLQGQYDGAVRLVNGAVRLEAASAHELIPELMRRHGEAIRAVTLGRPTLEDVFIHETGRTFDGE